ncbi:hypothetical protein THOM_1799 [Trachipleistophora hominis]|uniref:Uncharacterized protein n=1 Tax=Trachipleistophora hominis TaxID=72359 RepID=L7JV22_TRAHO|nr:hypothetical protein THOM_1799 [Trachipleistophora hominis]
MSPGCLLTTSTNYESAKCTNVKCRLAAHATHSRDPSLAHI